MSCWQQGTAQPAICVLKGSQVLGQAPAGLIGGGSIQGAAVVFAKLLRCIKSYQRLASYIYYPILAVQVTASFSYCEPVAFKLVAYVPGAKIIVPGTGVSSNGLTSKWEVGYGILCRPLEPHALRMSVGRPRRILIRAEAPAVGQGEEDVGSVASSA